MENISPYDIGFIEGMGGILGTSNGNSDSRNLLLMCRTYHTDEVYRSILDLLDLSGVCDTTNGGYTVKCTEDFYNKELGKYLSDKSLDSDTRKFMLGYITSNGSVINDGITLNFKNENIYILFNLLATPTTTSQKDPNTFTISATYRGLSATDVLNCYHVISPLEEFTLPRADLEKVRVGSYSNPYANSIQTHNKNIRYVKLSSDAVSPSKVRSSDAGYDLTLITKIRQVGDVTFYGTGLAMSPPDGYYLQLVPRSSISKSDWMLANSTGIIDPSYRGEIIVALRDLSPEKNAILTLPARAVQIIPSKLNHFDISAVDTLDSTSRNSGGFGSTGK